MERKKIKIKKQKTKKKSLVFFINLLIAEIFCPKIIIQFFIISSSISGRKKGTSTKKESSFNVGGTLIREHSIATFVL